MGGDGRAARVGVEAEDVAEVEVAQRAARGELLLRALRREAARLLELSPLFRLSALGCPIDLAGAPASRVTYL